LTAAGGAQALSGLRVVDVTRMLAGPFATMLLGDLGADVVKIERPQGGDESRGYGPPFVGGESPYFMSANRNKRSLTLDLARPQGREVMHQLLERADVVMENLRPGGFARLGFSWPDLHTRYPRLVYAAISGFGQDGPAAQQPAYDQILQGMGGLMSITGEPDGEPMKVGVPIADLCCGMFTAIAVLAALRHRDLCGEGQMVDAALLDGQVALLTMQAGRYFATGRAPTRYGNRHPLIAPYQAIRARDSWVNVCAGNDSLWMRLCSALGLEGLAEDPRFAHNRDRVENYAALEPLLEEATMALDGDELVRRLQGAGVPAGPIRDIAEVFSDPQVEHRGLRLEVEHPAAGHVQLAGFPFRLSETPARLTRPPPTLGQHSDEVLGELGYGAEEVARLRRDGVV
jgi:crotonobetainyl-CoA:carnitine CoA-transferase CaiB-like acyl-CoA transferase